MVASTVKAESHALINADAAVLYDIIADYRQGHPAILPPRWFSGLEVERGGRGEGTVIRFGVKLPGSTRESTAEVSEPEPGRVLVERIRDDRGTVTTFTVDPVAEDRTRVTITTTWEARGLAGLFERMFAPAMLRRIYVDQLALLAKVAVERQGKGGA